MGDPTPRMTPPDSDSSLSDATQRLGEKKAAKQGALSNEMYIIALLDVIRSTPDSPERGRTSRRTAR